VALSSNSRVLITGGAGFVGTNVADRLLRDGHEVVILDNFSRPGVRSNAKWLRAQHRNNLHIVAADVRDAMAVRKAVQGVDHVFHFAAQVAVTTSVADPRFDFEVNLGGTMTLLEEMRRSSSPPSILFTSTNKVYGGLGDIAIQDVGGRYEPADAHWRSYGIGESRSLDFCSPYGCSKGGADQYVIDYAKSFGLHGVVFRMSCIYGLHQQGNEDQGWVAHFAKNALDRQRLTLYGDGRQVRDILFVDDLVSAMLTATDRIEELSGRAFNIGGGPGNAVSLLEVIDRITELTGRSMDIGYGEWRVGDQRWYVSDTRSFEQETGWRPLVDVDEGLGQLIHWLQGHGHAVAEAG